MKAAVISIFLVAFAVACTSGETHTPMEDSVPEPTSPPVEMPPPPQTPPPDDDPIEPPEEPEDPGDESVFEECATQYDAAKLKPLDMVVLLDRSGSMAEDGKWAATTTALQQFAAHPDSDGIGVSLGYFPETYSDVCLPCDYTCGVCFNGCCAPPTGDWCWSDGDCDGGGICVDYMCHAGGGNATCDVGDYAEPEVALATLPAAAGQLNISMANTSPAGGTPTGPALSGALSYATELAAIPDGNDVVVVLATDGEPTECQPQAIGDVASIAAAAAAAPDTPIPTFVIGVGDSTFNLNAIAAAGGTQSAYFVDADADATDNFLATLNEIRRIAVACQYEIPDVQGTIAYDLVNVAYKSTELDPLTPLANVANESACAISGGWYYDDAAAPTAIVMCPATCEALQGGDSTQVEIVYGCETIIN